jgi:hypothetical protein
MLVQDLKEGYLKIHSAYNHLRVGEYSLDAAPEVLKQLHILERVKDELLEIIKRLENV